MVLRNMTAGDIGEGHDNRMIPAICATRRNYAKSYQKNESPFGEHGEGDGDARKSALNARIYNQIFLIS